MRIILADSIRDAFRIANKKAAPLTAAGGVFFVACGLATAFLGRPSTPIALLAGVLAGAVCASLEVSGVCEPAGSGRRSSVRLVRPAAQGAEPDPVGDGQHQAGEVGRRHQRQGAGSGQGGPAGSRTRGDEHRGSPAGCEAGVAALGHAGAV